MTHSPPQPPRPSKSAHDEPPGRRVPGQEPPRPRRLPRTYRLALYGRSGSGKTCILATLAMPRAASPDGSTCVRLHPDPADQAGLEGQSLGAAWLDAAIERLEAGAVPEQNPGTIPPDKFNLRYQFAAAEVPEFRVELFDYSGEHINPREQHDPRSFASGLRGRMETMDGLLVVVEAPRPEESGSGAAAEARWLAEAFGEVRFDRPVPVALLVSKWDRRHELDDTTAADEAAGLAEFLDSGVAPEHTRLRDALRHAVGPANTRAFPVSAFGGHVREGGGERPRPGPLRPLGLESPFVWAAARRAKLDLEELGRRIGPGAGLRGLLAWHGPSDRRAFAERFRVGSSGRAEVDRLFRGEDRRLSVLAVSFILLVASAIFACVTTWDAVRWSTVQLARRQDAPDAEVEAALAWLGWYGTESGFFWHAASHRLVLTKAAARAELIELQEGRERRAWGEVSKAAGGVFTQEKPAREYLRRFPQGQHVPEARAVLATAAADRDRMRNEEALSKLEQQLKALPERSAVGALAALSKEFEALPPCLDREDAGQRRRRLTARDATNQRLNAARAAADWDHFTRSFRSLIAAGQVADAADLLEARHSGVKRSPEPDAGFRKLREEFLGVAPGLIEREAARLAEAHGWADARTLLDRCGLWHPDLRPEAVMARIRSARARVDRGQDAWLYAQLQSGHRLEQAGAYLDDAPLGTMNAEVRKYKEYLERHQGTLPLELRLKWIQWGEHCWNNGYNLVTVTLDRDKAIEATGVTSRALNQTTGFDPCKFEGRVDRVITVNVKVLDKDYLIGGGDHDHGEVEQSMTVEEFAKGQRLRLRFDHGYNEALIQVTGMPEEPPLPAWRPPR